MASSPEIRAFFAVDPSTEVLTRLKSDVEALRVLQPASGVRWVPLQNLHLTLRFLGRIPAAAMPEWVDAATAAVVEMPGFPIQVGGVRLFPSRSRPVALAAEVKSTDPLVALAGSLEAVARTRGLAAETRPFRAHLTLARIRARLPDASRLERESDELEMWVRDFVLYQSTPGGRAPTYDPLARIALGRSAGIPGGGR